MDRHAQTALPFGEAEGTHNERLNVLLLALMRCEADLTLARLCLAIFSGTQGGKAGTYKRTFRELGASNRWGLWCSAKTAQRAVERAKSLRLIRSEQTFDAAGHQSANAYAIDWDGIYSALDMSRRPGSTARRSDLAPDGQFVLGPGQSVLGGGQFDQPYKEVCLSVVSSPPPAPSASVGSAAAEFETTGSGRGRAWIEPDGRPILATVAADDWAGAAARLRNAGAINAGELVALARAAGRSIADLDRVAAVLAANPGRLLKPGGAAKFYLETGRWPVEGLIDPHADAERRRRDAERAQADRIAADERAARLAADQAQLDALEARLGPTLDALDEGQLAELAPRAFGDHPILLTQYRRGAWREPSLVRWRLLELLDASGGVPC